MAKAKKEHIAIREIKNQIAGKKVEIKTLNYHNEELKADKDKAKKKANALTTEENNVAIERREIDIEQLEDRLKMVKKAIADQEKASKAKPKKAPAKKAEKKTGKKGE